MAGVFLGGAALGIPVVMDGFISSVAALAASRIAPQALPYMVASHCSKEPAAHLILQELGKEPFLTCDMCLGGNRSGGALPAAVHGVRGLPQHEHLHGKQHRSV